MAVLTASVLAASVVVSSSRESRAQESGFGKSGVLGISWDQPLAAGQLAGINPGESHITPAPMTLTPLGFQYYSLSNGEGTETEFVLAPAVDYFVVDNFSLGAQVMVGVLSTPSRPGSGPGQTTTLYGIAPQLGVNIPLSDSVSFWPKVFFAYSGMSTDSNGESLSSGTLGVYAPFLFHIATHFYAGAGPDLSTQVFVNDSNGNANSNPAKVTTFGAMATFGGWFHIGGG